MKDSFEKELNQFFEQLKKTNKIGPSRTMNKRHVYLDQLWLVICIVIM